MIKWCEISDRASGPEQKRFNCLDEELRKCGLETELSFVSGTGDDLAAALEQARATMSQIRVSGRLGPKVLSLLERIPSSLLSLKSCDALVCDRGEWWPRFFLVEGLNQTLASDASTLDLGGSVFILGATTEARAAVAALSRIGFNKMILSDPNDVECTAFVEELRRSYFGIQFQAAPRNSVTQLPGICSIAVNTLTATEDQHSVEELGYFNFLKPNGFWLDLSIFPLNSSLRAEAQSVGAMIVPGAKVFATTDQLWAQSALKVSIDRDAYASKLASP